MLVFYELNAKGRCTYCPRLPPGGKPRRRWRGRHRTRYPLVWGSARFYAAGDIDTATTLLRFSSGALGVVENSRRAVYGYDIVTEVFGENGKIVVQAEPKTPLREYNKDGYRLDHYHFFMDRFGPAFRAELEAFFHAISNGKPPGPGSNDALESLKIALAATRSLKESRSVKLTEI
jgi:predicted dehydrogenase